MEGMVALASKILSQFLHRNISFTVVALAIILGRLFLKKFPKRFSYALWSCLGVRALFDLGLHIRLPRLGDKGAGTELGETINSAVASGQKYIFKMASVDTSAPANTAPAAQDILPLILFSIWATGVLLMVAYGIVNYLKIKKNTTVSFKEDSGLYRCDYIESPMAFGFVRPKVYIPSDCDVNAMRFVIEHEKTHIRRGDVYFKLVAFLILCAYWVNPLAWVAFKLFNLDMELSCDEAVIRKAGMDEKEEYSRWLLYYSTEERFASLAPTAFGETDTKRRVKNIMSLKKKSIIASAAGILITAAVVVVCFVLNPRTTEAAESETPAQEHVAESDTTSEAPATELERVETELTEELEALEAQTQELESQLESASQTITWINPFPASSAYQITSRFGDRANGMYHGAVDFAAERGTNLLAACGGKVESAGWAGDRGYALTVKVDEHISYRYCHLDEIFVKEGDTVSTGDIVATVGSTGVSTGPHLHLELMTDGNYFDPLRCIPIEETGQQVITVAGPFADSVKYHITDGYYESREGRDISHKAIDIAVPKGTEVLAIMDGTVESAGFDWDAGNFVVVRVNDDITYKYQHLESISVKEGDTINAGAPVATVGSTGRSTGPHLHLEISINGENVNPLDYITMPEDTRQATGE